MKDKIFLDTNILVYSYSETEPEKRIIAQNLITENITIISTQVVQELLNILSKKFNISWQQLPDVINEICINNIVFINTLNTINKGCNIAQKYRYSFYDSLIIASAIETNCVKLYSEDLQNNQVIEDKIQIINPFLG